MNFKKYFSLVAFATLTLTSYAQVYNYNDLGILFSKDDKRATARFNAISGAFGALGGDISSTTINPAGAAVAKLSNISVTGTGYQFQHTTNYYGESSTFETNNFRIPQIGAMFVFKPNRKSDWNKSAIYFNFRNKSNFNLNYQVESSVAIEPYYNEIQIEENDGSLTTYLFDRGLDQIVINSISGRSNVFDFGFSTVHKNKLHLGAAIKFHQIEFSQNEIFNEVNDDLPDTDENLGLFGNILDAQETTLVDIYGGGVSLSLGFIYKLNQHLRLGLSYETPTYYSRLIEDYEKEIDILEIESLGIDIPTEINGSYGNILRFKSPRVITASGAVVFGKKGLISADFTHKNYTSIYYSGTDFTDVNDNFVNNYRDTYNLNVGTEWRFDNFSIRGGASYEKDPNLVEGGGTNVDNIKGYSLGLGYNFGKTSFDLSYNNTDNINYYSIYNTSDLTIDKKLTQISGTLTINL